MMRQSSVVIIRRTDNHHYIRGVKRIWSICHEGDYKSSTERGASILSVDLH